MAYEYALVHVTYTIPLAVVLTVVLKPLLTGLDLYKTSVSILIAFFATLPWDSYLIRHGIWTYPPDAVVGPRLFGIPAEELFFFVIQTYTTALVYILLNKSTLHAEFLTNHRESPSYIRRLWRSGQVFLCLATLAGAALVKQGGKGTYLGLILIWACPFLLLTWSFSGYFLINLPPTRIAIPIVVPTLYLWIVDELTLGRGTWVIEPATKLGWSLWGNLDIEEAVFFLATNALIVSGLAAFDRGMAVLDTFYDTDPGAPKRPSAVSLVKAILHPPMEYDMKRVMGIREAASRLRQKSQSFYLASAAFQGRFRIDFVLLYSFCRVADDLVDDSVTGNEALAWIQKLTGYLDRAYGTAGEKPSPPDELVGYIEENFPVPSRAALTFLPIGRLPSGPLYELLEGFRTDLAFMYGEFPIENEAEIRTYAYRVASTVGELCLRLGFHHYPARLTEHEKAKLVGATTPLGYALQYVNIARDIQADAEIGRVYLPTTWLREVELTPRDLLDDPGQPKVEALRQRLLNLAFSEYERSRPAMDQLPDEVRRPLVVAIEGYMEIGRVLMEKNGVPSKTKGGRVTVPHLRRLWVAWKNLSISRG